MNPRKLFQRCFPSINDFAFLAPAILLFCLMGGVASMLVDADTGWHIRAGEWILDHHRLPTSDFFSFTKPGQPWFAWEWIWEISFAWFYRLAGMAGVILANVVIVCLTSIQLFHLIRRRSKSGLVAMGVTVLALLGMSVYLLARPQLVSFLFAVILLRVLERSREAGRDLPWIVVPGFIIWANVHPGFMAGLIILAAYTIGDLANALVASEPGLRTELLGRFRRSLLVMVACFLAPLINPYGYRLYAHIYSFLSDSYPLNHINEYKVVDFRTAPGRMFELMLFLSAPAAISRLLKREFTSTVLFLAWAHLALTSQRNIPFFMIAMAAPVACWIEEMVAAFSRTEAGNSIRDSAPGPQISPDELAGEDGLTRIPVLSILTIVLIFVMLRTPGSPPKFRPEYDPSIYPAGALAAVRQMGPSTRMVTTDIWGGYLIYRLYPDVRVFWDGRADFYGTPYNLAAIDALMGRPGWDKTLANNRITAVLVPVNQPLASLLAQTREWHVVYRDRIAILYQLSSAGKTS
ncbi:MAG TPA: hypothetical protein VJN43_16590 [Bryobacteraceae bacterium]|nr:hypothetical protein [Bryobacteraceae bacterium]